MKIIALKSYLEFRSEISDEFKVTRGQDKGSRVEDFRKCVGREATRFRTKHMTTTGEETHRHNRWQEWLHIKEVNYGSFIDTVDKINDDTISELENQQRDIEFYIAIYYRFHAFRKDLSFAKTIDELVFDGFLDDADDPVFREIAAPLTADKILKTWISQSSAGDWIRILPSELFGFGSPNNNLPSVAIGEAYRFMIKMPFEGYLHIISFVADETQSKKYNVFLLTKALGIYQKKIKGTYLMPPQSKGGIPVGGDPSLSVLIGIVTYENINLFNNIFEDSQLEITEVENALLNKFFQITQKLGNKNFKICKLEYKVDR